MREGGSHPELDEVPAQRKQGTHTEGLVSSRTVPEPRPVADFRATAEYVAILADLQRNSSGDKNITNAADDKYLKQHPDIAHQLYGLATDAGRISHQGPHQEKQESFEVDLETRDLIAQGRGLEVIRRVGWEKYRAALGEMHYSEVVDAQVQQIDGLKKMISRFQQPIPTKEVIRQNAESLKRSEALSQNLLKHVGKEQKQPNFYAEQEGNKKLWIFGRAPHSLETGKNGQKLMRRIYCAVPTATLPEAFKSLYFSLETTGVLRDIDVAMNLESYQGNGIQKTFENNSIILYCYGDNALIMEKVTKAVEEAKRAQPAAWSLSEQDRVDNKERTLKDFMIPLDDTTAFVEADNTKSYHSGPWGNIYSQMTGDIPGRPMGLSAFADKVRFWKTMPKAPIEGGYLIGKRSRSMPGLIARE